MIVNIAVVSSVTSDLTKLVLLKGNEALEKILFFFSKARKYGEEIKIKKKKKKFLYFRPQKRLFGSEARELNGGERSVS